jgi:hypothetical protein
MSMGDFDKSILKQYHSSIRFYIHLCDCIILAKISLIENYDAMKTIGKIIKYIILLGLLLFTFSLLRQYQTIFHDLSLNLLVPFIIASCVFAILYVIFLKKITRFFEVFIHELTHLFFALLTFNKPQHFSVSSTGGATSYEGNSNWVISLSPYLFPLISIIFVVIYIFIDKQYESIFKYIITICYIWYIATIIRNLSFKQSDISKSNGFFSILFIIFFNTCLTLCLIYFISDDVTGLWTLVRNTISIWGVI